MSMDLNEKESLLAKKRKTQEKMKSKDKNLDCCICFKTKVKKVRVSFAECNRILHRKRHRIKEK